MPQTTDSAVHGFELLHDTAIPEIRTHAQLFRHSKTGARLLSLQNDDENKCFGITFRTPPEDSTGIAHILEHSVLCGSRKYPLKEPFIELFKGSLKTFLNAMTGSAETYYPVASTNLRDFYNLIDVYLDCVFYPNLTRHTFAQEGWHYELEDAGQPLSFKGVVFNEMKGYFAAPHTRLHEHASASLFPESIYGLNSGGDPAVIPDLTYEAFKQFHQTYYHPSNAFIVFYGDDDPDERLRVMNEWLKDFEAREIDSSTPLQPRFSEPKRFSFPYPVEPESANVDKAYVMVNWMIGETIDPTEVMALGLLAHILLYTPASPLQKALMDSGLGEQVNGGMGGGQQWTFAAGLDGIKAEDADAVEALILQTLREQVESGLDPRTIEAAINTFEFAMRENNSGSFPRGLALMFNSLQLWLQGGDPIAGLAFEAPLSAIKERVASGERFFEDRAQRFLLDNPHRTTIVLEPDTELAAREAAQESARLEQVRATMSDEDVQRTIEETRELKRLQETPDPPEALATIPSLQLSDLDKHHKPIPLEVASLNKTPILYHDLFTNGIIYCDIGMNVQALPQELLPYLSLFSRSLTEIGTEHEDYVSLTQRIGAKTGGIWSHAAHWHCYPNHGDNGNTSWLFIRAKALPSQAPDMLAILRDLLLHVRLDNQERFRQLALEEKARLEANLGFGAGGYVRARLQAHFNQTGVVSEATGAISYLFFVRRLVDEINNDWPGVLQKLEQIRALLVNRDAMLVNVTLDEANWQTFAPQIEELVGVLPSAPVATHTWAPADFPKHEGMTMPTMVNSVGKAVDLFATGYKPHHSSQVITQYLGTTWMWDKVRMQGGAYGAHCGFNHVSGIFTLLSSQDPNLLNTIDIYDETSRFLRGLDLSTQEVTRSIIGAISNIDTYRLPDAKGWVSMQRYLVGESDELLQQQRDEVLGTTAAHFRAFADVLDSIKDQGHTVVIGSPEAVEGANRERRNWMEVTPIS